MKESSEACTFSLPAVQAWLPPSVAEVLIMSSANEVHYYIQK